jgi:small subunit ribosomal protein S6
MKPYELVVLLHPDLEIDVDTPINKVEGLIKGAGGNVSKRDNWGKKRLAYSVKKQQFGIYVYFELDLEPTQVRALEEQLRITEEVMRYLLVKRLVPQRRASERAAAKKAKNTEDTTATKDVTPATAGSAKEDK